MKAFDAGIPDSLLDGEDYQKALAIVLGCRTREQLDTARRYVEQYCSGHGGGKDCDELHDAIHKMDRLLFPCEGEDGG